MRFLRVGFIALATAVVAACASGGGGGGSVFTPPAPPAPSPTNSSISNLVADQVFSGPAATSTNEYNLTSGTTVIGSGAADTVSVAYDATAKSYTVSVSGRSQTFATGDVVSNASGETRFRKESAAGKDSLTLVTTPYTGPNSNRYVGMGYWQRYSITGDRQSDQFATFVYGLNTSAAAMPRTGRANFAIDVFGLSSVPGFEPSVLQGLGNFDVDFLAGVFSTRTFLSETALLTGAGVVGGGIELNGAGTLSSSDATFSGSVTAGSRNANLTGSISGRFYGPAADEIGASFSATNSDGASFTGSFTGQRANGPVVNLTLTNVITPQLFFARGMGLFVDKIDGHADFDVRTYRMTGQFQDRTSGNFSFGPGLSNMPGGEFTSTSIVGSSDPNFTVYQKTFGGRDVRLELFKVGAANSQLALTYSTLGRWQSTERGGIWTSNQHHHFVYGLETPERLLAARTGTARYEGVAYGAGANATTGVEYDVRGTSVFNIDFSRQTYSGDLTLNGRDNAGTVDFGRYDFAGRLSSTTKDSGATITYGGLTVGDLVTRFFGPSGEEIGGDFTIRVPETVQAGGAMIGGVAVARRK